ncbi:MAG: OsmC family protein [Promethearchaeota archaeon]
MKKTLISDESLRAYMDRYQKMQINKNTEEGNAIFISNVIAESEQIDNMHVMAKVGNFEIESDGPKELGGSGKVPGPMPMLLATLANCLEITALLYLSFSNINVNSIKVKVEGTYDKRSALEPKKEPLPGFYDINFTWYIHTEENPEKVEQILKKVEDVCPIKGTLNKTPNFHSKVEYIK